jgi:hypothetical protein
MKDVSRCSPSALASLARRGFTLGDAGGHALTAVGRQVAESCQALPEGAWGLLDRLSLAVSVLRAGPMQFEGGGTR